MAATAKLYQFKRAPKRIELFGDKAKKPESAEHIIEFPGGAIEVARTSDGNYWAHIIINRAWANSDQEGLHGAIGEVIGSRIADDKGIRDIENTREIAQIAVLIRPHR